jgi:dTDP-4-amino-4,6-dideoxygalactose transaminase
MKGIILAGGSITRLLAQGVPAIHYPIAPHQQQAYAKELGGLSLPLTAAIHHEVVSLPMSAVMTETRVSAVVAAVEIYRA